MTLLTSNVIDDLQQVLPLSNGHALEDLLRLIRCSIIVGRISVLDEVPEGPLPTRASACEFPTSMR